MWRKDYDDKKATTTSPRGGTTTVSSIGGYAVGPAPPTFSGPQKSMPFPQFTSSGVFNSMLSAPAMGQSVTAPRSISPSAPQSLKASAVPQRAVGQAGPQRAVSSPRGSLVLAPASNAIAAPTAAVPAALTAPLAALAGSGSMRIPSFALAPASPRAPAPSAVTQSAVPVGSVRGGSLRVPSRPIATSTASPRASSGWSSVPASAMPLAASLACATAPAGGSMQLSSLPSPIAPVDLSQSISSALMSSIKQAAATSLKPAIPAPLPKQTPSNPFTKTPTFSTATNASNLQAQPNNVQGRMVAPPKPLPAGPLFNSMEVSQKFSAAPIMPPTPAVQNVPGPPIEGPSVSPLLPSRGLPLMASLPVQDTSQGEKPVDAALQHLQELQLDDGHQHEPEEEEEEETEEPGMLQAMLPWAFAETTPAVPLREEAPHSPHASPYASLEAMGHAASRDLAAASNEAHSQHASLPQHAPLIPPGSPLASQGLPVPGLVGAPALGPPIAVQPLSPVGSSMPMLGQPLPSSPVHPAWSHLPIPAPPPGSPMGSGLLPPVVQPPINFPEHPASPVFLMGPNLFPPMPAPPIAMVEPPVTMGPAPLAPPMVSSAPLAPMLPQSPLPGGPPVAMPRMSPMAVGTPNFFSSNSVDTVPYGSPEHSRNAIPMGFTPVAAPMVPETRPASPSLGRPFVPPMRSPPMAPAPARSHGPLPHPDPGMLHTPQNVDLGREVAIREVELRVLRQEVISKEEEAVNLRDRIGGERLKIEDASGEVNVMEKKVGTIAGNRHAVLQASCVQISEKNSGLHKRLMQMEAEWNEKEIEIEILKQAVSNDEQKVRRMHEELGDLDLDHKEQGQKALWLAQHKEGLQRKAAIDVWHDNVQAQVREEHDLHAIQQQKQKIMEQMELVSQECSTLRALIPNLEHKCQLHVQGIQATHKRYEEMEMEVRLNQTASKMGQEVAQEQTHSQLAELDGLKARLEQQRRHNMQVIGTHQARNQQEVSSVQHMAELISLTECMREITSVLWQKGVKFEQDPLQRAVDEEVELLHHIKDAPVHGQPPPAASGALPPFGVMPGAGRSRSASPGPTAMEAFAPVSPWSGPGRSTARQAHLEMRPRLPSTPRSHSPAALYQGSPPPPPGMMPSGPGWGMPALVAPIPIGVALR